MMSSSRTFSVPKEYSDPLIELGWSSNRVAISFIELIDTIFRSFQGNDYFVGREAFKFSSVDKDDIDQYIHDTFGNEISITMQLIRDGDVFWVNNFKWR